MLKTFGDWAFAYVGGSEWLQMLTVKDVLI